MIVYGENIVLFEISEGFTKTKRRYKPLVTTFNWGTDFTSIDYTKLGIGGRIFRLRTRPIFLGQGSKTGS